MILPLGDSPNPRGVPVVTWALIGLNVAVYLLITLPLGMRAVDPSDPAVREYIDLLWRAYDGTVSVGALLANTSAYDLVVFQHGFRPADPSIADLVASMFLHGGLLHLFGNMLFLWIYGDNVEHRLGSVTFLVAYLATGAVATLAHAALAWGSPMPLVGASGAISGVLGFYFLFFPRNRVRLLIVLFPFWVDVVHVGARIVLGFYLLIDNLLPLLVSGTAGGIAHGAHLGGFVAGLAWAFALDRRELARGGDPGSPASIEAGLRLAAAGDPHGALSVFRRVIRRERTGSLAARAHLEAGLLHLYTLRRPVTAYAHLHDALDVGPTPETAVRARQALAEIEAR